MHLAEGILPASHALGWTGAAVPLLVWSLRESESLKVRIHALPL